MILLEGATIVTSEKEAEGSILIKDGKIAQVLYSEAEDYGFRVFKAKNAGAETVDCSGLHVMAGGIDTHVHFREPGLTHKADMATESLAAIYGGVTSVMDMPNTNPATVTAAALKGKLDLAKEKANTKTAFHIGATNDNAEAICKMVHEGDAEAGITPEDIAGVKVFMGSSTGNMLVDSSSTLGKLFSIKEKPTAKMRRQSRPTLRRQSKNTATTSLSLSTKTSEAAWHASSPASRPLNLRCNTAPS